jgi:hypothetical protein
MSHWHPVIILPLFNINKFNYKDSGHNLTGNYGRILRPQVRIFPGRGLS